MSLNALTSARSIAAAFADFTEHFETGSDILESSIGFKGGNLPAPVLWFPEQNFWAMFHPKQDVTGHWCAFGVDNPHHNSLLSVTCEINPPYQGINRRCTGVFVRSDNGTIYLAHSGKIGGGRIGIGKEPFLKFYGADTLDDVAWSDRQITECIVIGALDDDELRSHVAGFVHKVAAFRNQAVSKAS